LSDQVRNELKNIKELRYAYGQKIKSYPNVKGLGVGFKYIKGKRTEIKCITVFVSKKVPLSELDPDEIIPKEIEGVPTDIVETHFKIYQNVSSHQSRHDPLIGGISVGRSSSSGAGTFGVSVIDNQTNNDVILSCWHVLCQSFSWSKGDNIIQPAITDGGNSSDVIAELERGILNNEVDAAIAIFTNDRKLKDKNILGIKRAVGYEHASVGMHVKKSGRTTGVTEGVVIYTDVEDTVNYTKLGLGHRTFQHQIIVDGYSRPGDSGSAVLNDDDHIVGLLFAGGGNIYLANDIYNVIKHLEISPGFSVNDLLSININLLF